MWEDEDEMRFSKTEDLRIILHINEFKGAKKFLYSGSTGSMEVTHILGEGTSVVAVSGICEKMGTGPLSGK